MIRLLRLLMPALATLAVALTVCYFVGLHLIEVVGGFVVAGLLSFALAGALTLVGVNGLDQTRFGLLVGGRDRRVGNMLSVSRQPARFRSALIAMYTIPFGPITVLSFGLGVLAYVTISPRMFGSGNQFVMALLLIGPSIGICLIGRRAAAFGCIAGVTMAFLVGESLFLGDFESSGVRLLTCLVVVLATSAGVLVISALRRKQLRHSGRRPPAGQPAEDVKPAV
jgi:hypothetical protein